MIGPEFSRNRVRRSRPWLTAPTRSVVESIRLGRAEGSPVDEQVPGHDGHDEEHRRRDERADQERTSVHQERHDAEADACAEPATARERVQ